MNPRFLFCVHQRLSPRGGVTPAANCTDHTEPLYVRVYSRLSGVMLGRGAQIAEKHGQSKEWAPYFIEPRTQNKTVICLLYTYHTYGIRSIGYCVHKQWVILIRTKGFVRCSALNHVINQICHSSLESYDRERIIRKPQNPRTGNRDAYTVSSKRLSLCAWVT
jgi:hypothetical protein